MANNRITKQKRVLILLALSEGTAINSVCRMFSVGKNAVLRFIKEAGEACEDYHDRHFRDLTIAELQLDEQWAYVWAHRERLTTFQKQHNATLGDCWMWIALDPLSKAVVSWRTGKRTQMEANDFANDLASRVTGRVQVTSDALKAYAYAVPAAFGDRVAYATEVKQFASDNKDPKQWQRFAADPVTGAKRKAVAGKPNLSTATISHVERFFLTARQQNKRLARKTLAYSKRWDNHALTTSLHVFLYNFCRKHETTRQTPAVTLGVADKRWSMEDVVDMVERYSKRVEEDQFEKAFDTFNWNPPARKTYASQKPKTPWYLDPESGGPNPEVRKEGIAYEGDATMT